MIEYFTDCVTFYADLVCDFLLEEPIVYFTGAILLVFVCKILRDLCYKG